ncbi:DUF4056 domain-containing protein [Serratia ureilytica]|nr:DUF4056 domain-containing protein [Serratia ureilytica]MCC4108134.1 DUF4056 domain-containing protein [Serratia ureilytica]
MNIKTVLALLLFIVGDVKAALPIPLDLHLLPQQQASRAWPVATLTHAPDGLRPCCAFGYALRVEAWKVPVPFYRVGNVVEADNLGGHRYNDSFFGGLMSVLGLGNEKNGILYTRHGGFIDTAHVRDTSDMTFWLFSQILPHLGEPFTLSLGDELAHREVRLFPYPVPATARERYNLALWLSAQIAFQLAAWHEIAQWYGYESVPGFAEGISAFSVEDLYSNLLGARLAIGLLVSGHGETVAGYNIALSGMLSQALQELDAQPAAITRFHFDMLDGMWWDSHRRVPQKDLVLKRNYDTSNCRLPEHVPGEQHETYLLALSDTWHGQALRRWGELRLLPGRAMQRLPVPQSFYTVDDFLSLAQHAEAADLTYNGSISHRNSFGACKPIPALVKH